GYVTREELEKYFKATGQDLSVVDDWFKWFDFDDKGVIEAEDICDTLGIPMRPDYAERVKENRRKKPAEASGKAVNGGGDVHGSSTESLSPSTQSSNLEQLPEEEPTPTIQSSQKHKSMDSSNFVRQNSGFKAELIRAASTPGGKQATQPTPTDLEPANQEAPAEDEIQVSTASQAQHTAPMSQDPWLVDGFNGNGGVSARKTSISSASSESLRQKFEVLHEESVDEELLRDVMRIVKTNEDKVQEEKDMAKLLKDGVEEKHGKHWQAIVAYNNLGCNVEHEIRTFIYLRRDNHVYILFRTPIAD
uniref:EF-hand domain-containing protein n=1 Tax=Mesocestoides corti TaxID=53468 RepID=A0A5K3FFJ5_MESCO